MFQCWVLSALKSFPVVNARKCTYTHLHFLFQILGSFYCFFLGLFWILLNKFYTEGKKKDQDNQTSHNSAPQHRAEETQALPVQLGEVRFI